MFSVGVLIRIRRSISRGMKPRIRISTKMSWIRNTDQYDIYLKIFGSMSKLQPLHFFPPIIEIMRYRYRQLFNQK